MERHLTPENAHALLQLTQGTVWLMGASFVIGSLFSLLLVLVLDFVRRNKAQQ